MALNSVTLTGPEVVHYPGPRIVITSRRIDSADGTFVIRELGEIQRVQGYAHHARTVALICGGIELALAVPLSVVYGAVALMCVGVLVAAGMGAAVLHDGRRNPRWMALRAPYRGRVVTLFRSRDQQEFAKVQRAVIRAVESDRRPRW